MAKSPKFYFTMKQDVPYACVQIQLKDAETKVDFNSIINLALEINGSKVLLNLYLDFNYNTIDAPKATIRHTIDNNNTDTDTNKITIPRIIQMNIDADLKQSINNLLSFLDNIKHKINQEFENIQILEKDIITSFQVKQPSKTAKYSFDEESLTSAAEINARKNIKPVYIDSISSVNTTSVILTDINKDDDISKNELHIIKELYFHLKILCSRNEEILKDRFIYIIAELLRLITPYKLTDINNKRLIIMTIKLLIENEHIASDNLNITIDFILNDVIDVMILIDRRKIKIKERLSCLPFLC